MQTEVAIIGGGPAGCAAALNLKRIDPAIPVVLLERSDYQGIRIGETLPPAIHEILAQLGVWTAFAGTKPLEAYGTRACWGSEEPLENEFLFDPGGRGWHVDRAAFDAMLARSSREAGVDFRTTSRALSVERRPDGWRITADHGLTFESRFFVNAAGRNGIAGTRRQRPVFYDHLVGCLQFFEAARPIDSYTLIEACEYGWVYSASLPDGGLAAAVFSDADILKSYAVRSSKDWLGLLSRAVHTRERLADTRPSGAPTTHSARSQQLEFCAGEDWIAIGDAASTFDPLSSQGIYKALRSGIFAAYAIADARRGDGAAMQKYRRFVSEEYHEYLDARAFYYAQEQRWPDAPFWKRRHESITLDPARLLRSSLVGSPHSGMHLTSAETALIRRICAAPRPAHDVVREFTSCAGRPIPHRRAVLALQYLLERGLIQTA